MWADRATAERTGDLVHPHVAQTADPLKALRVQEVGFIDDQDHVLAALCRLGRQQLLGLGDQRGVMKPRGAAQLGDDDPVDPTQPHTRRAEIEHGVPGRIKAETAARAATVFPAPHSPEITPIACSAMHHEIRATASPWAPCACNIPGARSFPNGILENP